MLKVAYELLLLVINHISLKSSNLGKTVFINLNIESFVIRFMCAFLPIIPSMSFFFTEKFTSTLCTVESPKMLFTISASNLLELFFDL